MSSSISPLLADAVPALSEAVSEVAENSLFTFADPSDQDAFDAAATALAPAEWMHVTLRFHGPLDGALMLTVPEPLARRLGSAFAGVDSPEDLDVRSVDDFSGELGNMMCGAWLTREFPRDAFDLTPPEVRRESRVLPQAHGVPASQILYLSIDEAPVRLTVVAGSPAAEAPRG